MNISKTIFKEYTRCPQIAVLDEIYKKKMNAKISVFENDKFDKIRDLLSTMFDTETGEDLVNIVNAQQEALLPYYNQLEEEAMKIAQRKFNINIHYSLDTKKQKNFSFTDELGNNFYCYLDGYSQNLNEILIFEVKATTSKKFVELGYKVKDKEIPLFIDFDGILLPNPEANNPKKWEKLYDRYSDVGKYAFDIATERYFIEESIKQKYPELKDKRIKYYLTVLNNKYVFDGAKIDGKYDYHHDFLGHELVTFIDLTSLTLEYLPQIKIYKDLLIRNITNTKIEKPILGKFCERKKMTKCLFCKVCYKELLNHGSILEYLGNHHGFLDDNKNKVDIFELVNSGKTRLDSIPKTWLKSENQRIQRKCFDENITFLDKEKLKKAIKLIKYPIYHLDFESFPCPLPRFRGEVPYMQSLFQFSIHIERNFEDCDKQNDHISFLADDLEDHREELIKLLIDTIDLSNDGTVLVYNMNFEYNRIKELGKIFPEYKEKLDIIDDHMFDLMDLLKAKSSLYMSLGYSEEESKINPYYHNDLIGSYSIKKVLPIFSSLTYKGMEVANGTEAIAAYASFPSLEEEDLIELRKNLIKYCQQDTWAMVVILQEIINMVNNKKDTL